MRNDDGVYIGNTECKHWKNIDITQQKCCGGRIKKVAFVECELQGRLRADVQCVTRCPKFEKDTRDFK